MRVLEHGPTKWTVPASASGASSPRKCIKIHATTQISCWNRHSLLLHHILGKGTTEYRQQVGSDLRAVFQLQTVASGASLTRARLLSNVPPAPLRSSAPHINQELHDGQRSSTSPEISVCDLRIEMIIKPVVRCSGTH